MKRADAPTLRASLRALALELAEGGLESPDVEAERLLSLVIGAERASLALRADERLPADAATRLGVLVRRRLAGTPLQHLEGTTEFRDLQLVADARALVPRPETEQLVSLIRRVLTAARSPGPVRIVKRPGRPIVGGVLDIGTGSGVIALCLVAEGVAEFALGVDTSSSALEQAVENRSRAGLEGRVEFAPTGEDPFASLPADASFDVIVSNPPYVSDAEFDALPGEVRYFEPAEALRGGTDGLDLVRRIASRAADFLVEEGFLFLEIGESQAASVLRLLSEPACWDGIRVERDLAGRDRFVVARKA